MHVKKRRESIKALLIKLMASHSGKRRYNNGKVSVKNGYAEYCLGEL